jgi:phage FluMu protein Com
MSDHPREIRATTTRCTTCPALLVETRDAIGRPRLRCPDCQGVNRTPEPAGTVGPRNRQLSANSHELRWSPRVRTCVRCDAPLPVQAMGRPRKHCVDATACFHRAGARHGARPTERRAG